MDDQDLAALLDDVRSGALSPDDAATILRRLPYADLGYARIDHHRELRQHLPEAVYGPGKTPEQCARIVEELLAHGSGPVLLTRASREQADAALASCPGGSVTTTSLGDVHATIVWRGASGLKATVLIVTAGTADLYIAAECAAVLGAYGYQPRLFADCGVAGIHRLLEHYDELVAADAIIVIAGMEGALASVVGGISPAPLIAVPSCSGYGAGLQGITALLAMHASCAAGVTVVGIDNGFGAACAVARILGTVASEQSATVR